MTPTIIHDCGGRNGKRKGKGGERRRGRGRRSEGKGESRRGRGRSRSVVEIWGERNGHSRKWRHKKKEKRVQRDVMISATEGIVKSTRGGSEKQSQEHQRQPL